MLKLKLTAISGILFLIGIVLSNSSSASTSAKIDNAIQEIANYKTWTKITKEPIKVSFIADGQEVINFPPGAIGG